MLLFAVNACYSQQPAADKEKRHPQCHMAVVAGLRVGYCVGIWIRIVIYYTCDNRIYTILPPCRKRNILGDGSGEIVLGITVIPTFKRITRLSWCCGFGCLITPDNILTWYFTTAIAVKFYNARNVPPMI